MKPRAAFGPSILLSLLSSIVIAWLFAWPWLHTISGRQALVWLVALHVFLRFIVTALVRPLLVSHALIFGLLIRTGL
jgi:hypothetical protein